MQDFFNTTPYDAAWNLASDPHGRTMLTIAIKATFTIPGSGRFPEPAAEPVPLLPSDAYFGEPGRSAVQYPADLVLQKVATDVGLVGSAYSPDGTPVSDLAVSVQVGPLKKTVRVFGERCWEKKGLLGSFRPSAPERFTQMPLTYEHSYGGEDQNQIYPLNPLGTGFLVDHKAALGRRLPNVEDPAHLITSPKDQPEPAGFGFVAPYWPQREQHAGTRDEQWRLNHYPLLPTDFDYRFFNAAAPGLTSKGFLKGGESVRLFNLGPKLVPAFQLPAIELMTTVRIGKTPHYHGADLWTVLFEPEKERFCMTWGVSMDVGKQPGQIKYIKVLWKKS